MARNAVKAVLLERIVVPGDRPSATAGLLCGGRVKRTPPSPRAKSIGRRKTRWVARPLLTVHGCHCASAVRSVQGKDREKDAAAACAAAYAFASSRGARLLTHNSKYRSLADHACIGLERFVMY